VFAIHKVVRAISLAVLGFLIAGSPLASAAGPPPIPPAPVRLPAPALPGPAAPEVADALSPLGPGDAVNLHVFGQPDMESALTVADDGSIRVPLAGGVQVGGLSIDLAARRIEKTLKDGGFFVDPHVSLTVTQSVSQRVSVLGEVRTPGRYAIDSRTTILDLLAQAGGQTDLASTTIFILRPDATGTVKRYPVVLQGVGASRANTGATVPLRAGDSVYVPRAEQFFILGEVQKPAMYKIEPNMTVIQAISIAGGVTPKGSDRRVDIKRVGPNGSEVIIKAKANDLVQPDDVIRVKESIF
jgi:polysaccharide export outer membrane protein